MKDLWQKWKVKLIFRGAWNSLMAWPDWTWPPLFYDGTTPLSSVSKSLAPSAQAFSVSALPVCNFLSLSLSLSLLSSKTSSAQSKDWTIRHYILESLSVYYYRSLLSYWQYCFHTAKMLGNPPQGNQEHVIYNGQQQGWKTPGEFWGWTSPWNVVHFPFSSVTLLVGR